MDILGKVRRTIEEYELLSPGERVVVGVSGGPDSLCLLHVLNRLRGEYDIELHVAHLNHLIRGEEADADAAFVAKLAEDWGLPATVEARDVPALAKAKGLAIEEAARQARYSFLGEVAYRIGARTIAVGHNADDQTETVIMHWLRGAGLAGLRGMQPMTEMKEMRLGEKSFDLRVIRPLLEVTRAEIKAYCREHGLQPRFDRSNLDTTYFRNRLRHELIPYLESYNPNIRELVRRSAKVIAADYEFLRSELERVWPQVVIKETDKQVTFDLEGWRALPLSLKRSTLREAIHRLRRSLRNIDWIHVEDARIALETKGAGTKVTLPRGLMLTIGYGEFFVAEEGQIEFPTDLPLLFVDVLPLSVPGTTELPQSDWLVEARILSREELPPNWEENPDPWQAFLDHEKTGPNLILRHRNKGDRFQPLGMEGHQVTLSAFMINVKIPSHLRDLIPIVATPCHIVWVAGWRLDERVKITEGTERILHLTFRQAT